MKNEFGHIFKQLMSEMPIHSAKPDTWQKLNDKLDEDISISRLRETLKQKKHTPEPELWDSIEAELNRSDSRRHFFNMFSLNVLLALFVITSGTFLYLLFHKNPDSLKAKTCCRSKNEIDIIGKKFANPEKDKTYAISPCMNKNNSDLNDKNFNKEKQLTNSNSIRKNTIKPHENLQQKNKDNSLATNIIPAQTMNNGQKNEDSSYEMMPSIDFDKAKFNPKEKETCSISGKINWEMSKKGYVSLYVYDEDGNLIKNIFEKKECDIGEQSYDFKLVNCHIEKNKKYFLRLMLKKVMIKEIECMAE